jgi:hypothetical protein
LEPSLASGPNPVTATNGILTTQSLALSSIEHGFLYCPNAFSNFCSK